jgi:hypothetical protein
MIEDIIKQIYDKSSPYFFIIKNILKEKQFLLAEAQSEVAWQLLNSKEKALKAMQNGSFDFFFIKIVQNQINSKSSQFYRDFESVSYKFRNKKDDYEKYINDNAKFDEEQAVFDEINNESLNKIKQAFKSIEKTWFEERIWQLYFENPKLSYRKIKAMHDDSLSHILIYKTINSLKKRIKEEIQKQNKKNNI